MIACRCVGFIVQISLKPKQLSTIGYLPLLISHCCQGCGMVANIVNYSSQGEYVEAVNNKTMKADFVMPVLGRSDLDTVAGSYFIPLLNIGEITVVMCRKTKGEILHDVIHSCLKLWPLLSVCLMMTYIAGFIVWITVSFITKNCTFL